MYMSQLLLAEDEQHYPTRSKQTTYDAVACPQRERRECV